MKANELRIGNYLQGQQVVQVTRIFDEDNIGIGSGDPYAVHAEPPYKPCLSPIPITEEWLVKFGFKDVASDSKFKNKDSLIILFENNKFIYQNLFFIESDTELKYVHQLQNLYFALTGKELLCAE